MPGKVLFISLFIFLSATCTYGQVLKFKPSEKLDKSINSPSEESMPLLSPGQDQIFFTRTLFRLNAGGENAGQDIWVSHKKQDGTWTKANNNFPEWNNRFNNAIVGMSSDGKTVYLLNSYQVEGQTKGLAFSRFVNGKWTRPEKINIKGIELTGYIGFYMNSTYDVLIISMQGRDSMGEEDLYVSFLGEKGKWSKPKSLGATINSAGFEISPFLSDDKRTLFFASNGRIGYGDADIYMSQRLYDSWEVWSTPENLGPAINSDKFDAYFSLYDSTAYFVSNRDGELSDIYTSTVDKEVVDLSRIAMERLVFEADSILSSLQGEQVQTEAGPAQPATSSEVEVRFLNFGFNSADLSSKTQSQIDKFIPANGSVISIRLIAFSDDLSNPILDEELSYKRLEEVKDYLTSKGIEESKIAYEVTNSADKVSKNKSGVEIRLIN